MIVHMQEDKLAHDSSDKIQLAKQITEASPKAVRVNMMLAKRQGWTYKYTFPQGERNKTNKSFYHTIYHSSPFHIISLFPYTSMPKIFRSSTVISCGSRGHVLEQKKIKGERWTSFKHISTTNLEKKMSQRKSCIVYKSLSLCRCCTFFNFP